MFYRFLDLVLFLSYHGDLRIETTVIIHVSVSKEGKLMYNTVRITYLRLILSFVMQFLSLFCM